MSDRWAVALAVATALGAHLASGPSPVYGVALAALALLVRRPWLLCLGSALLASGLGERAWDGLAAPPPGPLQGTVTLVSDPEPADGGLRADVRYDGHRYEARFGESAAAVAADRLAGEQLVVQGQVQRPPPGADWLARRHVVAVVRVDAVAGWAPGSAVSRLANGLRRTLVAGASSLDAERRSLFTGFVVGDDRFQSAVVTDDFRGAGLTHLLAVSGQNVAFVLALVAPALRRLSLGTRLGATLAVIGFFALMTRFEPSVLRASAMAALATVAATAGRETSRLRLLALAVTGLVLIDPLLVGSVGFGLSVAASAGILVLAPALITALPGPRPLATVLGVTAAAQLGVAPILIPVFGGLPVASLPANLLAVPVAGPVMLWGLTGGLVAGVVGDPAAGLLHVPTDLAVGWIAAVARWAGALPLGELRLAHLAVLATTGAVVMAVVRWPGRRRRLVIGLVAAVAVVTLLAPAVALRASPPPVIEVARGAVLWRAGGGTLVILDGRSRPGPVLEGLRRAGASRVSAVIVRTPAAGGRESALAISDRSSSTLVLGPGGADGLNPGGVTGGVTGVVTTVAAATTVAVGGLVAYLEPEAGGLSVDVSVDVTVSR